MFILRYDCLRLIKLGLLTVFACLIIGMVISFAWMRGVNAWRADSSQKESL
jgi:hypothetical protein